MATKSNIFTIRPFTEKSLLTSGLIPNLSLSGVGDSFYCIPPPWLYFPWGVGVWTVGNLLTTVVLQLLCFERWEGRG